MQPRARIGCLIAVAALMISSTASTFGQSREPGFVAPPRTIADITAILDQQRPDPKAIEGIRRAAGASAPKGASGSALAEFYHDRAQARGAIGLISGATADADMAVRAARGKVEPVTLGRLLQLSALLRVQAGETKKAVEMFNAMARELNVRGSQGWLFNAYRALVRLSISQGDFRSAEEYARRQQALIAQARSWPVYSTYRNSYEAFIEDSKGNISEAKGQYREAEVFYRRAEARQRAAADLAHTYPSRVPRDQMVGSADTIVLRIARVKARQGRLAEAEADVRRALLSRLKAQGKFSTQMPIFVATFAEMLTEQGRYSEAEQLARTQLEILQVIGVARDADNYAQALHQHASILNLQGRWQEAEKAYDDLDNATRKWEPARKEALRLDTEYIYALYNTNNLSAGITAAERLVTRQKTRFGEKHPNTALAHGLLGIGYARAGRDADALREFRSAVPVLMARAHEGDDDNPTTSAAREQRTQIVVEAYIALLARAAPGTVADPAAESFRLVDVIRGQSVQNALTASSARSRAKTPALAELVRKAQDLEKQHGAQLGLLNNVLSLPPAERDDRVVKALQLDVDKMRAARDSAKREIAAKFPEYASLVDPSPPTVEDIRTVLRADEVFLSIYFGRDASFIWAVPKAGPVTFAPIAMSAGQLESKVKALRGALEPNASSIGEIPPFDLTLAHELYAQILKPVEAGWRPAKSLIVATNGALGLLPLGVLPTAPVELKSDAEPYFAGYRDVPWLYRTHAVSLVPSASALRILRQLPPGSKKREQVIGFGDPLFNKDQAVEAARSELPVEVAMSVRGLALKRRAAPQLSDAASAQIGLLPRLPDTTDELKSVALALEADPSKVLHLGVAANEEMVKKANLSHYRIIVFATHGLVPGELDGLHQPALALSAPDVAGVKGDGLLTMEEILALKLDADWVVLSACNTGSGAGAGAEAASGLGRAFFYAGTRALLVTNWSVHSASARELVTDLFRRQAADPRLSRAEALRQAAVALLDGKGFSDAEGKTLFSYAHPLFWAPYTIIGDGGGTVD